SYTAVPPFPYTTLFRSPQPLRHRLRPRSRRAVPKPALRGCPGRDLKPIRFGAENVEKGVETLRGTRVRRPSTGVPTLVVAELPRSEEHTSELQSRENLV